MKIDNFHNHVNQDSELFRVLRFLPRPQENGPWLAGGAVWKAIENHPITHDFDFFFSSQEQCSQWVRTLNSIPYVHHIVGEKSNKYNTTYQFHIHDRGYNKTIAVQCVCFKFWSSLEELLDGFDFTACQFGFDGYRMLVGDTSFEDLRTRTIRFNKVHDSVATAVHLDKYIKKGFKIPPSEQQKFDEIIKAFAEKKNKPATISSLSSSDDEGYPLPEPTPVSIINTLDSLVSFDSWTSTTMQTSYTTLNNTTTPF